MGLEGMWGFTRAGAEYYRGWIPGLRFVASVSDAGTEKTCESGFSDKSLCLWGVNI